MPYLINLKSDNEKREYLKRLFAEVYIKDGGICKNTETKRSRVAFWVIDSYKIVSIYVRGDLPYENKRRIRHVQSGS